MEADKNEVWKLKNDISDMLKEHNCHLELGTDALGCLNIYVVSNDLTESATINQGGNPVTDMCTIKTIRKHSNKYTFLYDENGKVKL